MSIFYRYLLIAFLFFLLIVVRAVSSEIFYDPLVLYFEGEYMEDNLPDMNFLLLVINMFLRFLMNSVISILIIWLFFLNKNYIRFSILFLSIMFVVLISMFTVLILFMEYNYLLLFYVRRFIIHPIFLLLLLPAFYYQYLLENKKTS